MVTVYASFTAVNNDPTEIKEITGCASILLTPSKLFKVTSFLFVLLHFVGATLFVLSSVILTMCYTVKVIKSNMFYIMLGIAQSTSV